MTPLSTQSLTISAGARVLVRDLSLSLQRGEFLAILGRNGCGKTLTLHALAGLLPAGAGRAHAGGTNTGRACAGRVLLNDVDLGGLPRRRIAQSLGLLPQDREESLALSALESVMIGRHPHLQFWQREGPQDLAIAHAALARLGLSHCATRLVTTLSGGEQRRVEMAALLAQAPMIYLLDEPSNHLDPHHQIEILTVFRGLCEQGASIVATLHDPTLAERFADRALLLHGDGRYELGPAAQVLNRDSLSTLYLIPMQAFGQPPRRAFIPA